MAVATKTKTEAGTGSNPAVQQRQVEALRNAWDQLGEFRKEFDPKDIRPVRYKGMMAHCLAAYNAAATCLGLPTLKPAPKVA